MDILTTQTHPAFSQQQIIENLNKHEIHTVVDFMKTHPSVIQKATDISVRDIQEIRKFFCKTYAPKSRNASICFRNIPSQHAIIQTGIDCLDRLLSGGVFTGNIYELYGLPASGKTLFCLTLIKNNVLKLEGPVYYLDTKRDFSGLKLKKLLKYCTKEQLGEALTKTRVIQINSRNEIIAALNEINTQLKNECKSKLIIIDSLYPLYFQSDDVGQNNAFLTLLANILNYLTKERHVAVIVTNLLRKEGEEEKSACGGYWAGVAQVKLKLHKVDNKGIFTLIKTNKVNKSRVSECTVDFTEDGVVEIK